jgi:hypothetical protein
MEIVKPAQQVTLLVQATKSPVLPVLELLSLSEELPPLAPHVTPHALPVTTTTETVSPAPMLSSFPTTSSVRHVPMELISHQVLVSLAPMPVQLAIPPTETVKLVQLDPFWVRPPAQNALEILTQLEE